ncbi:uncharacterized protein LOC100263481 isoform X4 [Vitis vinifera]|uniref:uncharacterized protein LOC100263481 isoform X4 n=1 Tax=Vitis vinifera TaxID=29760 RepID=UPI00053FF40E|nr:uncharacterized protein LOC100263481 isoform X4 [Vitis vinifera]|eukprot:XP_010654463.1 PREDICTED: uncharacterized protein LOC100263481 isoform X4 [Vitis vinifera]
METVVGVEGNDEAKFEDCVVEKSGPEPTQSKQIADPVVYKLVRVDGDGRLVPATDDEVMEVEDLLEEFKIEMPFVADTGQTVECTSKEEFPSGNPHLECSEGMLQSVNTEIDAEKLSARLEQRHRACLSASLSSYSEKSTQEIVPSSVLSSNDTHIDQSGSVGECSNPPGGPMDSGSSASAVCTSLKPDFTKLKGEICLDNLSIRELHETFKATFGRETSVKDKQWLKRRIAMGLTNSCDVSTTTFIFKDNKSMKKVKEECCKSVDGTLIEDTVVGAKNDNCRDSPTSRNNRGEAHQILSGKRLRNSSVEYDCGSDDLHTEQIAGKRIRKPTKRYIEELSEADSREYGGRLTSSVKNSVHGQSSPKSQARPVRNVCSEGKTVVTRLDSLGGSGVQVPYVFRVRRSRPRKNFMALMKFNTNSMGMAAKLVKKALGVRSSRTDNEGGNKVLQSRPAPKRLQLPLIGEPVKHEQCSVADTIELEQRVELKHVDSSGDTSDDNIATVPTAKGGMRRKHHRAWTLSEVMKLVDGVSRYGAGRWSEIKRLAFASYSYRTSVDLKDKWRNLLRASFALSPAEKGMSSRKHGSMPIPAAILLKVRELAEMHAQVAPNLGTSKPSGCGGRTVHETRAGFL